MSGLTLEQWKKKIDELERAQTPCPCSECRMERHETFIRERISGKELTNEKQKA
jgi:hypothetical protein